MADNHDGSSNTDNNTEHNSTAQEIFLENEDLSVLSPAQQGFIRVICGIEEEINDNTTGNDVKAMVVEAYPPEYLFDPDLAAYPKMYIKLRNWLDKHHAGLGNHPTRRVVNLLAERLYTQSADIEHAKDLARALLQPRVRRAVGGAGGAAASNTHGSGQTMPLDRIAQNIGMRYSKDSMKFTGAEDQAFHEHVGFYLKIARDFSLNTEQKLMFMYNMFDGEAMRFFDSNVDGRVETFSEAVLMINKQYNSKTRQTAVQNRLTNLCLGKLVAEGASEKHALKTIYDTITKLAPQLPPNYRDDSHKVGYLRLSVVGVMWAKQTIGRLATEDLSFEQLYSELVNAQQLEEDWNMAPYRTEGGTSGTQANVAKSNFFTGQGMYGRPNKGVGATRPAAFKSGGAPAKDGSGRRFDPLSIAGCFNCDDPKHVLKDCPKPINTVKTTRNKVAYYDKKTKGGRASVAAVLYQLALQVNPSATVSDANDLEEVLIFGEPEDASSGGQAPDTHYLVDSDGDDAAEGGGSTQVGFPRGA